MLCPGINPDSFQVKCAVQTYAWGKIGKDSEVAKLSKSGDSNFALDEDAPYAELWMGTHPKGPSVLFTSPEKSLSDWIEQHPACIGEKVMTAFPKSGQLPFLFKVLSVNKSLSIQAHPNKTHAEVLHKEKPDKYPDDNHKPEMAIALTPFEGMCGFRPKAEIVAFMENVPEFGSIMGLELVQELKQVSEEDDVKVTLQKCFTSLMTCEPEFVRDQLAKLVGRLEKAGKNSKDMSASLGELLLRLHGQFPGDVGCFCAYFLNHLLLYPGEALFLGANLPHAYLSGDCMECMACSDNVVRAGLTPKFKDVSVLCAMLDYTCRPAEENKFSSSLDPTDKYVALYDPPVPDFSVARIKIPSGDTSYTLSPVDSASIVLVVEGSADSEADGQSLDLHRGVVLFVSAHKSLLLNISPTGGMLMFRAFCKL